MRSFALASGSSGNCFYVESSSGVKVLVDLGLPYNITKDVLSSRGVDISQVKNILITHEHTDHIMGLKTFVEKHKDVKVYITKGTLDCIKDVSQFDNFEIVKNHDHFSIDDMKIFTIGKVHDASEPVSFILDDGVKVGIFTDIGVVSDEMKHSMKNLDVIYFEANYCDEFVSERGKKFNSQYLNRLVSDKGHLSLVQSAEALCDAALNAKKIILTHVSENLNSYENTYRRIFEALNSKGISAELLVSFQGEPTDWVE